jgi:hypothetical protein
MRNLDLDWEDQYDYGPNEMVELHRNNPREYDKIMAQNVGSKSDIEAFYRRNLESAADALYQQRRNRSN